MSPLPAPPELILLPDPIPYDFLVPLAAIPGIDDTPPPFSMVVLRDGVGVSTSFRSSSCCSYCAPQVLVLLTLAECPWPWMLA